VHFANIHCEYDKKVFEVQYNGIKLFLFTLGNAQLLTDGHGARTD
jgi:hypothetical protein